MTTLNERIREVRKYLGLSQKDFAEKVGISQRSVSWGEQPGNNVPDSTIKSLCIVFRISEAWLRTGEGEMLEQPETFSLDRYLKENGCTALEMEIVKAYFELDFDTRQKVFDHFQGRLSAAKERLAADAGQRPEAKAPQEMTDAELHAELDRQLLEEKIQAGDQSAFGPGKSGTATG